MYVRRHRINDCADVAASERAVKRLNQSHIGIAHIALPKDRVVQMPQNTLPRDLRFRRPIRCGVTFA